MVIKEMVHITPYHLDRMLHIYLPDDYEESEARYPVMYMYDAIMRATSVWRSFRPMISRILTDKGFMERAKSLCSGWSMS